MKDNKVDYYNSCANSVRDFLNGQELTGMDVNCLMRLLYDKFSCRVRHSTQGCTVSSFPSYENIAGVVREMVMGKFPKKRLRRKTSPEDKYGSSLSERIVEDARENFLWIMSSSLPPNSKKLIDRIEIFHNKNSYFDNREQQKIEAGYRVEIYYKDETWKVFDYQDFVKENLLE